jgi:hypothetical protein
MLQKGDESGPQGNALFFLPPYDFGYLAMERFIRKIHAKPFQKNHPAAFVIPAYRGPGSVLSDGNAVRFSNLNPRLYTGPFSVKHEAVHIKEDPLDSKSFFGHQAT